MLTTNGKNHIRRYLAEYVPSIAGAMAFGVGSRAAIGGDFALHFEALRSPINSRVFDFANNKLIYKATVPAEFSGVVTELGLFSLYEDPKAGVGVSRLLTDIQEGEGWVNSGTAVSSTFFVDLDTDLNRSFPRFGTSGLRQTPAASGTANDSLTDIMLDMTSYSGADFITVALNVGNANTSTIAVRFMTDASNYYSFSVAAGGAGYKVFEFAKGGATVTGSPDWASIREIRLSTTSGGGGASDVTWDAIGLVDTDTVNLDYVLVARKVLDTPIVVAANQSQEVEFTVDVTL